MNDSDVPSNGGSIDARTADDGLAEALASMTLVAKQHDRKRSVTKITVTPIINSTNQGVFCHAQVQDRKFRAGSIFTLTRHKHQIDEIAAYVCGQLRNPFGPGHKELVSQWRLWYHHLHQQLTNYKATGSPPSERFMDTGIKLVSTLFLPGGLHCCDFKWKAYRWNNQIVAGLCRPRQRYERDWVHICIDPEDHHIVLGGHSYAASILGTLLHECVHAFLDIYSCTVHKRHICRHKP